jgi:glycosyltransferase involved in cell wall biosynthesis
VDQFERLGVHTVVLERPTPLRLLRVLRNVGADVAHVADVWPEAVVAARLAGVRRVLVTHHTPSLPRRDNLRGRLWRRLGWALRPEVIYTSEADRRLDGRSPSHVVPLGIDLRRFASGVPALPHDGPLVGAVGRLVSQKDHDTLLEAARLVREQRPAVVFALVGDGELRPKLEARARELGLAGAVTFTGERADVPDVLASFDVFAQPSLFEGFCLSILEAQAAGVPVVATAVGGVAEAVEHERTGLVVPLRDPGSLADAIVRLVDDRALAARLAEQARRRAQEFSEGRMVEATLSLYDARRR